jgi:hypothetical protein
MVIDTNYLQAGDLKSYLSASTGNKVVVTPFVELEMLKGDAPVNVVKSTEILAERSKQVVLIKGPMSVARLKGRRKGMKKRLIGDGRTSAFRSGVAIPENEPGAATNDPCAASLAEPLELAPSSRTCGKMRRPFNRT